MIFPYLQSVYFDGHQGCTSGITAVSELLYILYVHKIIRLRALSIIWCLTKAGRGFIRVREMQKFRGLCLLSLSGVHLQPAFTCVQVYLNERSPLTYIGWIFGQGIF